MARRSRMPRADICEPCWRSADGSASVHVRIRRATDPEIVVVRLDVDPDDPRALRVLAGDNYVSHLAEDDERALTEMLRELKDSVGLEGTGFDEMMLANLVMVTRNASEIHGVDAAAEWVGMPDFDPGENAIILSIQFRSEADREEFMRRTEVELTRRGAKGTWGAWWPKTGDGREDLESLRWESGDETVS